MSFARSAVNFYYTCFMWLRNKSKDLEQARRAHSPSHTHGHDGPSCLAAAAFEQNMSRQPRACHAERMPNGNRAAIDVQPLIRDAQPLLTVHSLRGEGLIELPQVDVLDLEAGTCQQPGNREHRADTHFIGFATRHRHSAEGTQCLQTAAFSFLCFHQYAGAG